MSKHNFKVGDKVRVKKFNKRPFHWNSGGNMDYLMGTIVEIHSVCADGDLRIESKGENLGYWYLRPEDVEPLKNECIVIYRKGQEVIALDKATDKKAIAKCSPEDEFDFNIGSKLAFERLLGIEEQKEAKPKFLKKFEEGKLYVFRKEIYLKRPITHFDWIEHVDGKVVDVKDEQNGFIDGFVIYPVWCEEIGYKKEK